MNEIHPSLSFTMELEENGKLPFLGMVIIRNGPRLDMKVYVKPTDTGLLLHYHSHVDIRYKHSLQKTMLNRAFKLSSNCGSSINFRCRSPHFDCLLLVFFRR